MVNGPPCAACANPLRWFPEQNGWGCDRCRQFYPAQEQVAQQASSQPGAQQPYSPFPANHGVPHGAVAAPVVAKKSNAVLFGALGAGAIAVIIGVVVATRGGSGGGSGSKEDVAKATIAALSSGDLDALMKVADVEAMMTSAVECDKDGGGTYGFDEEVKQEVKDAKRKFERRVDDLKGAKLEFVRLVSDDDDDDDGRVKKKGERMGKGCVAKEDFTKHRVKVKVKVTEKDAEGEPYEQTVSLRIVQIGNKYFLDRISEIELQGSGEMAATLKKVRELTNKMCACRDKACADRVNEEYTKWGMEMAKKARRSRDYSKPNVELAKEMTELVTRYTECYTKLMMAGM